MVRVRSWHRAHWTIVFFSAVALVVVYYGHRYSLPTRPDSPWSWFWDIFFFEYKNDALGLALLFPILYAALTLGWKRALTVMVVLLIAISPYVVDLSHKSFTILSSVSFIVIPPLMVMSLEIKLISDARERAAEERKARERTEVLRQVLRAQEDERKRISQELHDGVAQTLLVTATLAHNLLETPAGVEESVRADLEMIKEKSLGLVAEVRTICQGLRPSILDTLGLVSAINWLAANVREETGLAVDVELTGRVYQLGQEESLVVFRVVQEALSNVVKHAGASSVRVILRFDERTLTVEIVDDGQGFELVDNISVFAVGGRLGLLGMSDRAQTIGAALSIDSAPDRGTCVSIAVTRDAPGHGSIPRVAGAGLDAAGTEPAAVSLPAS